MKNTCFIRYIIFPSIWASTFVIKQSQYYMTSVTWTCHTLIWLIRYTPEKGNLKAIGVAPKKMNFPAYFMFLFIGSKQIVRLLWPKFIAAIIIHYPGCKYTEGK